MITNHLILDFSHVYCDENIPKNDKVHWLDCSDITECDLYCSKPAEEEIRARIAPYGIHGIHFLDSGNYHYVTGIMTALIKQKFSLILLDHHTDMQKPMIEQMTSCGDWAGKVIKTNLWLVRSRNKPVSDCQPMVYGNIPRDGGYKSIPLYSLLNQCGCFLFSRKGAGLKLFEAVKEAVTARNAVEYYGIKVGRNGMAVCPFHPDKNPSTKLDKRYHCFACQADGDVIDFGLSGGGKEH